MDRRSLIFFILTVSSFLLVNNYFSSQKLAEENALVKEEQRKKEEVQRKIVKKSTQQSLTPSDFSLKTLTKDQNLLAYGAEYENHFITFAWAKDLPSQLDGNLSLSFSNDQAGEPVLYQTKESKLKLPPFPEYDGAEFYLLSFDKTPIVSFGKTYKGELLVSSPLQSDALAFIEIDHQYHPVGIYSAHDHKIRALKAYLKFQDHIEIETVSLKKVSNEKYYVLENDYQMLVFSTKGGALAEINLPFETKENPHSVVKKIDFDRTMEQKHPDDDYFPQKGYTTFVDGKKRSFDEGVLGGYYPLLRRSLLTKTEDHEMNPDYYAFNIVGDGTEDLHYKVTRFEPNLIEFTASQPHRKIIKRFSLPENPKDAPYIVNLEVTIQGDARGLWLSSGVPEVELVSGSFTPALKYRETRGHQSNVEKISLPTEKASKDTVLVTSIKPDWIVNSNGFFGMILDPLTNIPSGYQAKYIPGLSVPTRLSLIDSKYDAYPAKKYPGYEMMLPLMSQDTMEFRLFAGPFQDTILSTIDENYTDPSTSYNPDYSAAQSFHGWFSFISAPFAKFLFFLMKIFYSVTGSWGIAIILLTLALRIMLYPLNAWSHKSMSRMQEIGPELKRIQEKYKKDKQRLQIETMKLYKEKGANPFMGCFPMFIQIPFVIGMFDLLKSTFVLRGATFIPGWIDNLTEPDVLFSWGYPIIFFGTSFHLLPFLVGGVMYLQGKITARLSGTPQQGPLTDQQKQQNTMGLMMAVMFTLFFYNFASGLNLYWFSSSVIGIAQQWYMKRSKNQNLKEPQPLKRKK